MKLIAVVLLLAAVMLNSRIDVPQVALLLFGLLNVLLAARGTLAIRTLSIGCALAGLASNRQDVAVSVLFAAILIWPAAFLVAWAFAREHDEAEIRGEPTALHPTRARVAVATIIAALTVGTLAYRWIFSEGLQQTAMLFVGLPALLAIIVILSSAPRSATGLACTVVTVGLLVSVMFLGEGMLCVMMAAPIFYGVAIGIARASDRIRHVERPDRIMYSSSAMAVIALMSVEGLTPSLSLDRRETVTATRVVNASAGSIAAAVLAPPRFERGMPPPLRAGFPHPESVRIDGGRWTIRMRGGEMRLDGMEPRAGNLVLELIESRAGIARWTARSDDSHMTHFLKWRSAMVQWQPIDENATAVTWTLEYDRSLDPSWYFGPWERFVAGIAAGYLIDAVATP